MFYIAIVIGATLGVIATTALTSPIVADWFWNRRLKAISAEFDAERAEEAAKRNS